MSDLDLMSEDGNATTPLHQLPTATTSTTTTTIPENDDDNDPIVASYSVFIKPSLAKHRKLVVLDYVNRTAPDPNQLEQPKVLGLRIKPSTGMYEVDVPIDTSEHYDKNKGVQYGVALHKSMEAKKGGSLGLAGGFGVGAPTAPRAGGRRGGGGGGNNEEEEPMTWGEAVRLDKVLRKQTLGGGRKAEEENTKHMVGVIQGKNIHLTPVSSVVHLRPVAHHLDAATEQERLSRPQPGGPGGGPGGSGGPGGAAGDKASAGRAIHMTLKAAMDDSGGATAETISDRLRAVQKESWSHMKYVNDESDDAWAAYNECLLLRTIGQQANKPPSADDIKGKGKEIETEKEGDDSGSPELVNRVAHLKTDWVEDDLLRAMSGIGKNDKKPGEEAVALSESQAKLAAKLAAAKEASKEKGKGKAPAVSATAEEALTSPVRKRGRPARGGAAAGAGATRGGRAAGGAGSSSGNAMQID